MTLLKIYVAIILFNLLFVSFLIWRTGRKKKPVGVDDPTITPFQERLN